MTKVRTKPKKERKIGFLKNQKLYKPALVSFGIIVFAITSLLIWKPGIAKGEYSFSDILKMLSGQELKNEAKSSAVTPNPDSTSSTTPLTTPTPTTTNNTEAKKNSPQDQAKNDELQRQKNQLIAEMAENMRCQNLGDQYYADYQYAYDTSLSTYNSNVAILQQKMNNDSLSNYNYWYNLIDAEMTIKRNTVSTARSKFNQMMTSGGCAGHFTNL